MLVFVAATANAQSSSDAHPYLSSKFSIDVGVFMPQSTFKIGVGGTVDPAPFDPIDFETELRSDVDEEIAAIQFNWRFGEKWSLRAQYIEWSDRSSAVLANDVEWGDITFGAGTGVGAATARALAKRGCAVLVNYSRSKDAAEGVAAEVEAEALPEVEDEWDPFEDG